MINKKRILKLAMIGGSVESAVGYTHLIASQMDHRWQVVSGCFSRRKEINAATIEAWNLHDIRLYNDWKVLLENEFNRVDAIAILTPTPMHREMVIKALKLGYAVICEKALASNYKEGLEICEVLNQTKGFLAVTHNYTGYPMLRELRRLVKYGQLGQLTQIQIEMPQEGFARLDAKGNKPSPQKWRLHDGLIPSVSLDLGAHLQHMIHYIANENPIGLIADQHSYGWFHDIIDDVSCIAHYPSGMKSDMWFGKAAIGHRNGLRIRVFGTQGSAEWYQMEPEVLFWHDIQGNKKWIDRAADVQLASELRYNRFKSGHPAGFVEAFANLYYDIADQLEEYQETKIYDSYWTYGALQATIGLHVLEIMNRSAKEQKWLPIKSLYERISRQRGGGLDLTKMLNIKNQLDSHICFLVEKFVSKENIVTRFLLGRNEHSILLAKLFDIDGFIDDFVDDVSWNGKPIIKSEKIPDNAIVINCSMSISPVSAGQKLQKLKIKNGGYLNYSDLLVVKSDMIPVPAFVAEMREDIKENEIHWRYLAEKFADEESIKIFNDLINYRLTADPFYMIDHSTRLSDQYFENFLTLSNEVFVDAGGFDGDTTEEFCERYPTYKKVILFEPSKKNMLNAKKRLANRRDIEFITQGLSDICGTLSFNPDSGSASAVSNAGSCRIDVITLDEAVKEKVTFIKMDLEGWELNALKGCKQHIIEDHPKLAIAVYHRASDFWRVPEYIFSIRQDYNIHIRHYTEGWSETVMFFVPKKETPLAI